MKYLILQNTLSPYRISLFNKLYENGLDFEVLYMCELETGRSWKINKDIIKYPYIITDGYKGKIKGFPLYWCPNFIKRFVNEKNDKIILGGSWNFPDVIVTCILKRLGIINTEILFWSEANYMTTGARKKNKLRDILRHFVLNTGEGRAILPGKMAIDTFKKWGIDNKEFILLPNVIDEDIFLPLTAGAKYFSPMNDFPVFLLPVRLIERIKGVLNFFKAIGNDNIKKAKFYVLGDGPDEEMIKLYIKNNKLQDNIVLTGFCQMDDVAQYYLKSEVLVLPSFTDQSPLALVEGCCCRMPILASNRCGNHFETIEEGQNGYTFNPDNHDEVRDAFEKMLERRKEWSAMGEHSRELFNRNFKQDVVLPRFITAIEHA